MPILFDEAYYLLSKAKLLNAAKFDGHANHTAASVKTEMAKLGFTPENHFNQFGKAEGVSPNKLFNESEYLSAKKAALAESDPTWAMKSIADLKAELAKQGFSAYDHYTQYGAFETKKDGTLLNPSNAFDTNAFFAAKLQQLQASKYPGADKMTVADVVKAFQEQGLDPLNHYASFGAAEAKGDGVPMIQTVPTSQRVPNDPLRNEGVKDNVAANYNQPTPGALNPAAKPGAVTKPADSTGLNGTPPASPTAPVKTPGDAGFKAPPKGVVDDGKNVILEPTGTGTGTGPNDSWIVVDPAKPGVGTVINQNGHVQGTVDIKNDASGNPTPPKADASVKDENGNETNDKPVSDGGKPVEPPKPVEPENPGGDGGGGDDGGGGGGTTDPVKSSVVLEADKATTTKVVATGSVGDVGDTITVTKIETAPVADETVTNTDTVKTTNSGKELKVDGPTAIDASAVTGTSSLTIDTTKASKHDLDITGSKTAGTTFNTKGAKSITGGGKNDTLNVAAGGTVTGPIDMGAGNDTINGITGSHKITSTGTLTVKTDATTGLTLTAGSTVADLKTTDVAKFIIDGTGTKVDKVTFGTGANNDTLTVSKAATVGEINFGAGNDKMNGVTGSHKITSTGTLTVAGADATKGVVSLYLADGSVLNNLTATDKDDVLSINANATVTGTINLGDGVDILNVDGSAVFTGKVDMGGGMGNLLYITGTATTLNLSTMFAGGLARVGTLELNPGITGLTLKADTFAEKTTIAGLTPFDTVSIAQFGDKVWTQVTTSSADVNNAGQYYFDVNNKILTYHNGTKAIGVGFAYNSTLVKGNVVVDAAGNLVWTEGTKPEDLKLTGSIAGNVATITGMAAPTSDTVTLEGKTVKIHGTAVASGELADNSTITAKDVVYGTVGTLKIDTTEATVSHSVSGSQLLENSVALGAKATAYTGGRKGDIITLAEITADTNLTLTDTSDGNVLNLGGGDKAITLKSGTNFMGNIKGNSIGDKLIIENSAKIDGEIDLGAGNDVLSIKGAAPAVSVVDPVTAYTIIGGDGADWIRGGDGVDTIYAGAKDGTTATITSNNASVMEVFNGKAWNVNTFAKGDWLTNKAVKVLDMANVLEGGRGNDELHASAAKDVFLFQTGGKTAGRTGELSFTELGADTIKGFTVGTDKLMIMDQDSLDMDATDGSATTTGARDFSAGWGFGAVGENKTGALTIKGKTGLTWSLDGTTAATVMVKKTGETGGKLNYSITISDDVLGVDPTTAGDAVDTTLIINLVGVTEITAANIASLFDAGVTPPAV